MGGREIDRPGEATHGPAGQLVSACIADLTV